MKACVLIIGIDGWEQYTAPLLTSLARHEADLGFVIVDNASEEPYPEMDGVIRTERLSYAAAINRARQEAGDDFDWYIVLSNDVVCTGPFTERLFKKHKSNELVGPQVIYSVGIPAHVQGWCVCIPAPVWKLIGDWDERFSLSSWEDVDYSLRVYKMGLKLIEDKGLRFMHLDQRQRFGLDGFYASNDANIQYLRRKHSLG